MRLQAMPAVETLLDGLEFSDDAAVVLDQALGPLLSTLSSGSKEASTRYGHLQVARTPVRTWCPGYIQVVTHMGDTGGS